MIFNSFEFAVFLPIVFCLYWFVFHKKLIHQNVFLILAGCVFYGWWDWRFLSLLFITSLTDYFVAIKIQEAPDQRMKKRFLAISLIGNLGMLGFFKYFNFFRDSFIDLFHLIGFEPDFVTLNIILPVGISFYTFQSLSYTIDVYRGKMEPTRNIISFLAFVSFFPVMLAGPIERAAHLLPQFSNIRPFNRSAAQDGMRQILWGLFKKMVIADNCSPFVDHIFRNYETLGPSTLLVGAFYFSFQIYGDFSGYSDIAIGTGRLFGFNLSKNFAYPYFSRDVGEFWRRWHISLSSWFRDYVYIPLGGNRGTLSRVAINTLITFTVSGFWHGANWTFVIWGLLNGLYLLPLMLAKAHKRNTGVVAENTWLPTPGEFLSMVVTFFLVMIAWVFFRATNVHDAFHYIVSMLTFTKYDMPHTIGMSTVMPLLGILVVVEWLHRKREFGLEISYLPQAVRWATYFVLTGIVAYFASEQDLTFIYFQF
jgi:alginate O-acetyltransferase complex protein AlgI